MPVQFFSEDVSFQLRTPETHASWVELIISEHQHSLVDLNYIFCSDEYLLNINRDHLDHDYYTDIITFDNSEDSDQIEGDIFISIDRVEENAKDNNVTFDNELSRVIAHGLLHLLGFGDKTDDEKAVMREKEDACISLQKN